MSIEIEGIPQFSLPMPPHFAGMIAHILDNWDGTIPNMPEASEYEREVVQIFASLLHEHAAENMVKYLADAGISTLSKYLEDK